MKRTRLLTAAVLCIFSIVLLAGCTSQKEQAAAAVIENNTPGQLYTQAISRITESPAFTLSVQSERIITTGSQSLWEEQQQTVTYRDYATDSPTVFAEQTYTYGTQTVACSHMYANGSGFLALGDACFTSKLSIETYTGSLVPVTYLDTSLYGMVEAKASGERILIGFADASAPESWACPNGVELQSAAGTVLLDATGAFLKGTYTLTWSDGAYTIAQRYSIQPVPEAVTLTQSWDDAVSVQALFAPLALERSCALLLSAQTLSSRSEETIRCQLSGLTRTETAEVTLDEQDYRMDLTVSLADKSRSDEVTTQFQTETFRDGVYTIEKDGVTSREDVTGEEMNQYCRGLLVRNIPLLGYIRSVCVQYTDGETILTFDTTEEFARIVCASACETLYQDPALLDSLSTSYQTDTMECTLQIHSGTGLPMVFSSVYKGIHTIHENTYTLICDSRLDFTF